MKTECGCPEGRCCHVASPAAREAFLLLMSLSEEQRGLVLCWFCNGCNRYVGPGDACRCGESR